MSFHCIAYAAGHQIFKLAIDGWWIACRVFSLMSTQASPMQPVPWVACFLLVSRAEDCVLCWEGEVWCYHTLTVLLLIQVCCDQESPFRLRA